MIRVLMGLGDEEKKILLCWFQVGTGEERTWWREVVSLKKQTKKKKKKQ